MMIFSGQIHGTDNKSARGRLFNGKVIHEIEFLHQITLLPSSQSLTIFTTEIDISNPTQQGFIFTFPAVNPSR